MDGRRGPVSRGMLPLLAIHAASEYYRNPQKPPVTAALMAAQTLIYLRPGPLHRLLPTLPQVAFNPYLILKYGDLKRFFLSALYHTGESHLVYNMMSLLWKGMQLETSMGSPEFAAMIASLLAMSQGITLMLAEGLRLFFDYDAPYYDQYAVGFSGVLFAMKVALNSVSDDFTHLHGMLIPTRHAVWAELILIQMFVPGVSFVGHLGGILAGLVYLQLKSRFSGPNPLNTMFRGIVGIVSWPMRLIGGLFRFRRPLISARGRVGRFRPQPSSSGGVWRCHVCTYHNSIMDDSCEMCSTERMEQASSASARQSTYQSDDLSLDELRRRRVERFSR